MKSELTEKQLEIVAEIQRIAKSLNVERLSQNEYEQHHEITGLTTVGYHFGSWNRAVIAAGLKPYPPGGGDREPKISSPELLQEIIRVHRDIGKQPSEREFSRFGQFSLKPYKDRWGSFSKARELAYETLGV